MKTKSCALCKKEDSTMYRVRLAKGGEWMFVCTDCCNKVKLQPGYTYGGTWKGYRH